MVGVETLSCLPNLIQHPDGLIDFIKTGYHIINWKVIKQT